MDEIKSVNALKPSFNNSADKFNNFLIPPINSKSLKQFNHPAETNSKTLTTNKNNINDSFYQMQISNKKIISQSQNKNSIPTKSLNTSHMTLNDTLQAVDNFLDLSQGLGRLGIVFKISVSIFLDLRI